MCFGKRQQIQIGNLVMTQHARPVDKTTGAQRQAIGPEFVVQIAKNFAQFVADLVKANGAKFAVARKIQNANNAVFHQGAARNFQVSLLKKSQHAQMVDMRLIKQRYPYIDIKQKAQIKRLLDPSNLEHAQW